MNLFDQTTRPSQGLFYRRNDPRDIRLGELVKSHPSNYDEAEIVILGCPQDEGVRRNNGRVGARLAPTEIRRELYRLAGGGDINALKIFDIGDLKISSPLEEIHERQTEVVQQILAHGKRIVSFGGGNDISYPDCRGLSRVWEDPLAFNIDSHFDVRADNPRNSGTPYRQLIEEEVIQARRLYEIGVKFESNSPEYLRYLEHKGVHVYSLDQVRDHEINRLFEDILNRESAKAIFWGFDLDSVRAADAPGVSAPSPIGFSGEEICRIAAIAGSDPRTRLVEFTEVNPSYDIDNRTSKLVALMILNFIMARNKTLKQSLRRDSRQHNNLLQQQGDREDESLGFVPLRDPVLLRRAE